jgi:hypothetical protein
MCGGELTLRNLTTNEAWAGNSATTASVAATSGVGSKEDNILLILLALVGLHAAHSYALRHSLS